MIAFDLEEAVCVDLFAGTGNLGLEALSRGSRKVLFLRQLKRSFKHHKKNIAHCGSGTQISSAAR